MELKARRQKTEVEGAESVKEAGESVLQAEQ